MICELYLDKAVKNKMCASTAENCDCWNDQIYKSWGTQGVLTGTSESGSQHVTHACTFCLKFQMPTRVKLHIQKAAEARF